MVPAATGQLTFQTTGCGATLECGSVGAAWRRELYMLSPELEMKTSGHNLNACHPDLHVRS